jgi:hypothetical protein
MTSANLAGALLARKLSSFSGYDPIINILYLRVTIYYRGPVSGLLYAVVAVVSLCGPPSLHRVQRSHVNWVLVEGIRGAWFLLQLAVKSLARIQCVNGVTMQCEEHNQKVLRSEERKETPTMGCVQNTL